MQCLQIELILCLLLNQLQVRTKNGFGDSLAVAHIGAEDPVSPGRTVADWIASLPGVTLNGQGGLLQGYSVRGFSRWRIRTEVVGVPIITDRRAGNSVSFLPPDLLAGTTVQRGPGSSLYGSGAMGAVISLQSIAASGTSARPSGR